MSSALHIDAAGERGPVLVLQHGFAGSARNWRPQIRALRERARVVSFDACGHARSADRLATRNFALADFVRDFGDVADRFAATEPVVAGGLSLGAAVALHFALARPERVRALLLAAIPAGRGAEVGVSREAIAFAELLETEGLEAAGQRFVWGESSGLDGGAAKLVRAGFLEHRAEPLAAILRQTLAGLPSLADLAPRLAALTVPTLVIVGLDDPISLEASRELAHRLPDSRLVEVAGAGHVVNLAQPERFDAAVAEFLDELEDGVAS